MKPKLSIYVIALHKRLSLRFELMEALHQQPRFAEVELLVVSDGGRSILGQKRNQLIQAATGEFIAAIDDDDLVSPNYVASILDAIEREPEADVVLVRGCRTDPYGDPITFDYRLGGAEGERDEHGVFWRTPGHLCAVRTAIAKAIPFSIANVGEDLLWNQAIAPYLKKAVRAGQPDEVLYHYRWDPMNGVSGKGFIPPSNHAPIFTPQYTERSGPGSTVEFTLPYRQFLERFIHDHKIRSILDLGCGDLEVMSRVDLQGASYLGVDCIAERVQRNTAAYHPRLRFQCRDFHTWAPPPTDLILCKDVIQHWSTAEVTAWLRILDRAKPGFRFALVTNCNYGSTVNTDIETGGWRAIDLLRPPFSAGTIGTVVFQWNQKDVVLIRGDAP